MKKKQVVEQSAPIWSDHVARGVREGAMILLFFLSLYMMLALATFQVSDPGWTNIGTTQKVGNAGGPAGAWFADVLMSLFGYLAFLFPVLVAYRAWLVFREIGRAHV